MRCPDCNKFVPFDTEAEPEVNSEDFDGEFFSAEVRRVLPCGECGSELKEYTFSVEDVEGKIEVSDEETAEMATVKGKAKADPGREEELDETLDEEDEDELDDLADEHEHDWNVTAEATATMRTITKDRHGKPIKKARYMKTEYGIEVEFEATCECGAVARASYEDYVQASSMEELT